MTNCNRDGALAAVESIEKKRAALLNKAKDDKVKAKINQKIDKKLEFWKKKIAKYDTLLKDYKRSLVRSTD
jgi:hypothetical protein